jgi:gamma-glutamylcyclotransferase (GGCT)/AIG2-like uncharacterized protein YtfP
MRSQTNCSVSAGMKVKADLFVYGTLTKESAPHEIAGAVKKLKYVGQGFVLGHLCDLGKYPGAILDTDAGSKIFGKTYELLKDRDVLNRLDAYEEFDPRRPTKSLFVRTQASISRPNRKKLKGWVYEYNRNVDERPLIENGRYSKKAA